MQRIRRLLVANRGEVASRVFRTAREMGIGTVAVYLDADAHAPFVVAADRAFRLPGNSYLDAAAILDVARRAGADAVHPGYGFLSENAEFARAVEAASLAWVGPPPDPRAPPGDKLAAKALATEVGVPTLPMTVDPADVGRGGYPVLVKASAGGGGKGMRLVEDPARLEEAVAAARRESRAAFGDDMVFLERYVARSRHIEVQVLGDTHGNLVHLGERECSIQRRHQKIIEEAPSPVVDPAMREALAEAALRLCGALGYVSAGTVEFLVDDDDRGPEGWRRFYFLEANTRLQVEHPVTEAVTGFDIVREQLLIAMGEPLRFAQSDVRINGHAVEARLYAEDPAAGFLPATGTVVAWRPDPAVRFDSGIAEGSVVGVDFDPMLAKVIAWAPTRGEAALKLAAALDRTRLAGVVTNRDFLSAVLRTDAFLAGDTTTDFIDRVGPAAAREPDAAVVFNAAAAAALWTVLRERAAAPALGFMRTGWRNAPLPATEITLVRGDTTHALRAAVQRDGSFLVGDGQTAVVHGFGDDWIDVEINGERIAVAITATASAVVVHHPDGDVEFVPRERFPRAVPEARPGGLHAPMPGTVARVDVDPGRSVKAGELLLILEAMKMEHHVVAPLDGTVGEVRVRVGDQVERGALLLDLEAAEPEGSLAS